ncbi:MAG: CerR family C-terminal domain-containing protein [Deltaproteobacteria bacterium]|jgi:AcrR family transcriptional regulator
MTLETAETRLRLLKTASSVFAEHGFAATTIRMISGEAKVNVAAVNYHFGSKEALYHEVLRHVRRQAYESYPVAYELTAGALPEEMLHAFIRSFLLRIFGDKRNSGFGTLMIREMVAPTSALDIIVDEGIRTLFDQLLEIVQLLLGADADRELVLACSRSTISQCVFYLCSRSVITRMTPEQTFGPDDIEKISEQITSFTLNALHGMAENRGRRPRDEKVKRKRLR